MGILVGLNTSATNNLIMKFLVLFAVVASAAAQLITHPNGAVTPDLTPEQKAATAAHLATKGFAHPYAFGYPYYHHGALVSYANGAVAPAETPEVVAAKQAHFAAHGIAAPVEPQDVIDARAEHLSHF